MKSLHARAEDFHNTSNRTTYENSSSLQASSVSINTPLTYLITILIKVEILLRIVTDHLFSVRERMKLNQAQKRAQNPTDPQLQNVNKGLAINRLKNGGTTTKLSCLRHTVLHKSQTRLTRIFQHAHAEESCHTVSSS